MIPVAPADIRTLIQDKYDGDRDADIENDIRRLTDGEPLAYVIGWIPFLGLKIFLDSHPLIPRPETEWWTERLIENLRAKNGSTIQILDLCAGSGAIGLAVLSTLPNSRVSFGELEIAHASTIQTNIKENNLDAARAAIHVGDLFKPFTGRTFDTIVTNPPYIPTTRELEKGVTAFEPEVALYSGIDGLDLIRQILQEAPAHLNPDGELWMECDISNIEEARELALASGFSASEVHNDQYDRPRLLISHRPLST